MAKKPAAKKSTTALPVGSAVIIRTVTHHYTGRLVGIVDGCLALDDAAWIADTGRWAEALRTGSLSEVEPYPGRAWISMGAVVDVSPWAHPLPREVR